MLDLLIAGVYLWVGMLSITISLGIVRYHFKMRRIEKFTAGMESGIFIQHGMVIDPETGECKPTQKPSQKAYDLL